MACAADAADCGTNDYAQLEASADFAGAVSYVQAAAAEGGDGSAAHPFNNLQTAVAAAPLAGTLLVGAGTYTGSLQIKGPLRIVGRCPAQVIVVGGTDPVLRVVGGFADLTRVQVSGVTLKGGGMGVEVIEGARLTLLRSLIQGVTRRGARIKYADSFLHAEDVVVQDVAAAGDHGFGIAVGTGAHAELLRVRIHAATGAGLGAWDPNTQVNAQDLVVTHTRISTDPVDSGVGAVVADGAGLQLRNARLDGNSFAAVFASGVGVHAALSGVRMSNTQPYGVSSMGYGLLALGTSQVEVVGSVIQGSTTAGLVAGHAGTRVDASGVAVELTRVASAIQQDYAASAVATESGAVLALRSSVVTTNQGVGIYAYSACLFVSDVVVADGDYAKYQTRDGIVDFADGIVVDSAHATIARALVTGNARAGVVLLDAPYALVTNSILSNSVFGLIMNGKLGTVPPTNLTVDNKQQNVSVNAELALPPPPALSKDGQTKADVKLPEPASEAVLNQCPWQPVQAQACIPAVFSVSPLLLHVGKLATVKIYGQCLPSSVIAEMEACNGLTTKQEGGELAVVNCVPQAVGTLQMTIRLAPGGAVLQAVKVQVGL